MSAAPDSEGKQDWPAPGSSEELRIFTELQRRLPEIYRTIFADPRAPRTVVVVPSLTLDEVGLGNIPGVTHYEERMLCLLMLLRMPRTELVYVTSTRVEPAIIDYYFDLLPAAPASHARSRLSLLTVDDKSSTPLTKKLLRRPDVVDRIRDLTRHRESSHLTVFVATEFERTLAVRLGLPMYATDPALAHLGNKSGSRELFREAGVTIPEGFEDLSDVDDITQALAEIARGNREARRGLVKLNEGFSGGGNAIWDYRWGTAPADIRKRLPERLELIGSEPFDQFIERFGVMGGVVEELIEGEERRSPSVQGRIDPAGNLEIISTHDQLLDERNQVYLGCTFPSDATYRRQIHDAGAAVGKALLSRSALGRFSIDFVSVKDDETWTHYAVEVNLRKGGTMLPYLMLQFLTGGGYDLTSGQHVTSAGVTRCYFASDNVRDDALRGLTPRELIHIAVDKGLHFDGSSHTGVVFHLLGALNAHGKLGMVCIEEDLESALGLATDTLVAIGASPTNSIQP